MNSIPEGLCLTTSVSGNRHDDEQQDDVMRAYSLCLLDRLRTAYLGN